MRKLKIMEKITYNPTLARKQLKLAFRRCYLNLQHYLLTCFEETKDKSKKSELNRYIKEVGETYKKLRQ